MLLFLLWKMKVIIFLPVKFLGSKDQLEKDINTLHSKGMCDYDFFFFLQNLPLKNTGCWLEKSV